ncbi:unnamed protein product [Nyctereutes procyonoides]|uniref:(raccoon dog) hypothetical protein n=1 Tax=Nyctereutes procyonoides TaxID=34880 RepID=A0A811ZQS3_NYCPR|nr:unnamed protein product [Nyctereutes procyonoides]
MIMAPHKKRHKSIVEHYNLRYLVEALRASAVETDVLGARAVSEEQPINFQTDLQSNSSSQNSFILPHPHQLKNGNSRLVVARGWGRQLCIEIMCIYKYGSMAMSFEAHNLTVPAIRWLGLLPSDIKRLNIPRDTLIPLTKRDQMKLDSVLKRPYVTCQPFWRKEMEIMADSKMKAEIQALTFLSSDYLSRVYLPNKLKFGGWI